MNKDSEKRLIKINEKYKVLNKELEKELKGETRGEYAGRYFLYKDAAVKVLGLDEEGDMEYLVALPSCDCSEYDLFVYQREFLTGFSGRTVKSTFGKEITKEEYVQKIWSKFWDVMNAND